MNNRKGKKMNLAILFGVPTVLAILALLRLVNNLEKGMAPMISHETGDYK
jgi:hypothetical protein